LGWQETIYAVTIRRKVDPSQLAVIDVKALEAADEAGFLAGNAMFQNLSGSTWEEAADALVAEAAFIARLAAAADLEMEAARIEEERSVAFDEIDALWNLDVGVIAATLALAALGCAPVGSCNAGGFGGEHQASHPYVAFHLSPMAMNQVMALAEAAGVGLLVDGDGLGRLYADRDLGLARFAELAVARRYSQP
jgi:hypothetical protein